jgi:hypothetical protein
MLGRIRLSQTGSAAGWDGGGGLLASGAGRISALQLVSPSKLVLAPQAGRGFDQDKVWQIAEWQQRHTREPGKGGIHRTARTLWA